MCSVMYASILLTQLLMYIMVRFHILAVYIQSIQASRNQARYIYLLAANTAVLYTLLTQQVVW